MPQVEINDEIMEAKLGEPLLTVARRNAAHIGFGCDGNGLCTMCECRVLEGGDQLSPLNKAEQAWLPDARVADGYRLACQASVRGKGPIRVVTRVEELRRQLGALLNPPAGTTSAEQLRPLLTNLVMINWEHLGRWPFNLLSTFQRLGPVRFLWPFNDTSQFLRDTVRVSERMLAGRRPATGETAKPKEDGGGS